MPEGRPPWHREPIPIERLIEGEVVNTPEGTTFRTETYYPPQFRYGAMTLAEIHTIPTYPAHLLVRDDRLKSLDLQKTLFLDTETTGLSGGTGTLAFLIGLGFFRGEGFIIRQLFVRDFSEERAALSLLEETLTSFGFLVTFNGRHYDVPLLETRMILSRIRTRIREIPNFDLLYPSRKIWRGAYENCRLVTLEARLLGMEREEDVPSEWIPSLYFEYLQTRDARKIHRVFYHNRMDILAMVALTARIHLIYHDPQAARPKKGIEHFSLGRLFWDHGEREKAIPCFEAALKRCDDELAWEVMKWLSMALKRTGRIEQARSVWEEMLSFPHPKDAHPYLELAKFHEHRLKDFKKAMDYVDRALALTPSHQGREIESLLLRKGRLAKKSRNATP
ncbi:MAG: ribonuclease H-like domain-containing protein [Desulfobacterota bacterium]|nr:ribonuclease H-like domain-containing protein [Thermodesulfobacteriota bacterium]